MIRPLLLAAALTFATPASAEDAAQRYQLDLSLVRDGAVLVSTSTQILEQVPAGASVVVGGARYDFEALLFVEQEQGDTAQLALETHLSRGDTEIAAPRLTLLRGQPARIEIGDVGGDALTLTIAPVD